MLRLLLIVGVLAAVAAWFISAPRPLPAATFAGLLGNANRGETVFWSAGCASCHMAEGAVGDAQLVLAGGKSFPSDFGTFRAPNISADTDHGIGAWTVADLGNALTRGVGRAGEHLYPSLPYTAYIHMARQDVADLHAYLQTLPADATPSQPHDLAFPFNIRRSLGFWKLLFLKEEFVVAGDLTAPERRGRMIVEGLAHCGECHTPRNLLGGLQRDAWLSGAPNPSGRGTIPNITPGALDWSEAEIVEYLTTGFTPDYDSAGGQMAEVVANMARLPESDRSAVAAYLKRVPAVAPCRAVILIGQFDSPYVRRVGIALRLYGMAFEHRPWSTFGDAVALQAVNPLMRVPTLLLDTGEALVDSVTILDHLDELFTDAALLPRSGAGRRQALRYTALALGVADKAVALLYGRRMHATVSDAWEARLLSQITTTLAVLDQSLRGAWFGDTLTHADIAMACCWRFLAEAHPSLGLWASPALADHAARLEATPAFRDIYQTFVAPS